jgi:signal transduction histidine kinase/DNA-binding response OmpR family regulator
MLQVLSLALHHDQDVVTARQRAAHLAQLLGFDLYEQTRIATAVSEIVRNAFRYARDGLVTFAMDVDSRPQRLVVTIADRGPGIARLDSVLSGRYQSSTGLGMGIQGARRIMDRFSIESSPAGTSVVLEKFLPARGTLFTADQLARIAEVVAQKQTPGLLEEIQRQNQELLRALDDLQRKQQELIHVNRELEDTNRGVVALYAELDEKADHLRRADELKSRFLSNMTHEFRTPVSSIIGLTRLLIDDRRQEGREPEPEITYIRDAAQQLSELVNDLLDLAKVEAGKTVVRPAEFQVETLFGALRGMLRPLLLNQSVVLVFDADPGLSALYTDEGKVSQILRNLISNGLKFTERGEVRISARLEPDGRTAAFEVRDTGIGIETADLPRIFEEFTQIEHRLQRGARGTGLGLPLSKRLAELLGGTLTVASQPGVGSTFSLRIPAHYRPPRPESFEWMPEDGKVPVLVVDDAPEELYFYEKAFSGSAFQLYPAKSVREAELALQTVVPAAVILDVRLGTEEAWDVLLRIKREERLSRVPVLVISSLSEREKSEALGADVFLPKPVERRLLLDTLQTFQMRAKPVRVLSIDDDKAIRYLIRQCLSAPQFELREALSGEDGLAMAHEEEPDIVVLDLLMPGLDGYAVLSRLRRDEKTRHIPVLVVTSALLDEDSRRRLMAHAEGFLPKSEITREAMPRAVRAALGTRNGPARDARSGFSPADIIDGSQGAA